jgi:hypothetical protein
VVAAIPTSFVDLLDKTITAAASFRELDSPAVAKLQEMAANRESIFLNEEKQVAMNLPHSKHDFPECPHEC